MPLYTYVSKNEALNPIINYNGNSKWLQNQRNSLLGMPTAEQTQVYNALGRNNGSEQQNEKNFFERKASSIGNAVGTTLSAPISGLRDFGENIATYALLNDTKSKMNDVYKKFGFEGREDYDRQLDAAEAAGDNNEVQRLLNLPGLQAALQIQANENANATNKKAAEYDDYRKNDLISQNINQDRGKFLGSAINTLSTAYDVASMATGLPNGPLANAVQGGVEGIADELEQNGLKNFSWDRAGQNAAIGAATGAVTGALNNGMSNALAKRGGNLLKGNNFVTRGINNFNKNNPIGRTLSTVGMGAARGAVSGAVGGATGAGLSSAFNGVDVGTGIGNALQGAVRGAQQGATTGATMAGINMAANAAINKANNFIKSRKATQDEQEVAPIATKNEVEANTSDSLIDQADAILSKYSALNDEIPTNSPEYGNYVSQRSDALNDLRSNFSDNDLAFLFTKTDDPKIKALISDSVSSPDVKARLADYEAQGPDSNNIYKNGTELGVKNAEDKINAYLEADSEGIPQGAPAYAKVEAAYDDAINTLRSTYTDEQLADILRSGAEPKVKSLVEAALNQQPPENLIYKNGTVANDKSYEGMSPSEMLNSKAQDAGFENYDAAVRNFTDTGEAAKGTDIVDWMDAKAMQSPETEVYRTTTGQNTQWDTIAQEAGYKNYDEAVQSYTKANPNAAVDSGKVLDWLDNGSPETEVYRTVTGTNKKPLTGEQIKAKAAITEDIRKQLNPIDKPTSRRTKPNQTFYNLYDEWGLSDGNDIRQAVSYADPDGLIPTMIKEAAGKSGVIDLSDAQAMVMDLGLKKSSNYKKAIAVLSDIWDSMEDKTIIGGKSGIDALTFQREVEKVAADALGMSGEYHVGNNVVDKTTAKNLMKIADNIGDKVDEAAIANNAVAETLADHAAEIQQMRNAFPNNPKWQESVDNKVSGAKTIRDLRSSIRDLTRANIYIENGDELIGTVGSTVAKGTKNIPTSEATLRNRLINDLYDKVNNSKAVREARIEANYKKLNGDNTNLPNTQVATTLDASTTAYNPATQLYNAIGRTEGATARDRVNNYLSESAQGTEVVPNTATVTATTPTSNVANTTTSNNTSTSVYNALTGTNSGVMGNSQNNTNGKSYFQPTGDYWTDIIGNAVSMAIDADDMEAFGTLYDMYQSQLANLEKQTTEKSQVKLTDKQRQANAAALALEDFSKVEPNAAYDVSDIPFIGQIANFGGNEYGSKAEALALQLGYMLSGATVNKEEAKNIGMAYVPQPRDNQATRQAKLNQIRGIISEYQKTYEEA